MIKSKPKERPILFSDAMVRAVLDGRKTQTRRPIKPQPVVTAHEEQFLPAAWATGHIDVACPFGKVGDRLWVRETWRHAYDRNLHKAVGYRSDGERRPISVSDLPEWDSEEYRAFMTGNADAWRPSIHMPRWASRITLEITDVRVERVQDISAEDALAEGVQIAPGCSCDTCHTTSNLCPADSNDAVFAFAWVWDTIYWERGLGWETNPWVWAISFRRVEGEQ